MADGQLESLKAGELLRSFVGRMQWLEFGLEFSVGNIMQAATHLVQ